MIFKKQLSYGLLLLALSHITNANGVFAFKMPAVSKRSSALYSELGELSVSEPPLLEPAWIEAAKTILPWEEPDNILPFDVWEQGQVWKYTRIKLVNLWVLPRDMSNGAWNSYAVAASKGEKRLIEQAPQLLRIPTDDVVSSARTILTEFQLPPALLRREPILLTIGSKRLQEGFKVLQYPNGKDGEMIPESILLEKCRDIEGFLADAAIQWKPDLSP